MSLRAYSALFLSDIYFETGEGISLVSQGYAIGLIVKLHLWCWWLSKSFSSSSHVSIIGRLSHPTVC